MIKKTLFTAIIALYASFAVAKEAPTPTSSPEVAADVISIKTPQVQIAAPSMHVSEVFMELDNNGQQSHDVIAAYSPVAKRVQLHKTLQQNGHSAMQQVRFIAIAPHHEQDLKQGGFHVMLIGLNKPINKGDIVPVVLLFDDGSYMNVNVPAA